MKDLGDRIQATRIRLNFTQSKLAEKVDSSAAAIGQYEKGAKIPGGKVLAGLARLGFDVNWLLTGERVKLDGELLKDVIAAVEVFLEVSKKNNLENDLMTNPETKAKWIVALYEDLLQENLAGENKANVEQRVHHKMGRILL